MPRSEKSRNTSLQRVTTPVPQSPLLKTMKEGFSFGLGNSLAHRFIGSLIPSVKSPVDNKEYTQCMSDTNDKAGCDHLLHR